jgi:4-diphosphocytidyl-2-C-methyl-D-erythritol kinase
MRPPARLRLVKRIPAAAGLGGGSADAAATLMLAAAHLGLTESEAAALAPGLGADVPFCLVGGSALVEGHGEIVITRPPARDFALAVAVPPFALATAAVYRRWDELGEPAGSAVDRRHLPDSLREEAPLVNDLLPAAADLVPELGDWIFDLRRHWGGPVMMSGSGPSLFAFFATIAEAEDAARAAGGARAVRACLPAARGWRREAPGTLR